jgi:hypothetical protein
MDHTTSDTLDQADEEILTYIVSDDALEAAAGGFVMNMGTHYEPLLLRCSLWCY